MSDERTAEQLASDNALDDLIKENCQLYGLLPADVMIIDWAIVIEAVSIHDEDTEHYIMNYRNGRMRTTTAIGMLERAKYRLLKIAALDDDEADTS